MDESKERPQIILASASPRRIELLRSLNLPFETATSSVEEETEVVGEPGEFVEQNAMAKAADVAARYSAGLVIGADTIVWFAGRALGKPADREDARRMLRLLARQGIHRPPQQTPLEFLRELRTRGVGCAAEAAFVTELFCANRYGNSPLSDTQQREIEQMNAILGRL